MNCIKIKQYLNKIMYCNLIEELSCGTEVGVYNFKQIEAYVDEHVYEPLYDLFYICLKREVKYLLRMIYRVYVFRWDVL